MRSRRLVACLALLLSVGLGACAFREAPIAGHEGLLPKIMRHYRQHAAERNYMCLAPEMQAITRVEVLENTPERLVVRVRYHWLDSLYGEEDAIGIGITVQRCQGFAERTFTFDKRLGMQIVAMSGPKRDD